jgi:multidrug efflux pump subunit AcrB
MINYLLKNEVKHDQPTKVKSSVWSKYQDHFENKFHRFRSTYGRILFWVLTHRKTTMIAFALIFASTLVIVPFIGKDFFPIIDAGQLRLHVQAPTGTRIEVTEEIFGHVEDAIRKIIPPEEIAFLIDNIGLVGEPYNYAFGDNTTLGSYDGEILIAFNKEKRKSTLDYMQILRNDLKKQFPHLQFFFQPADMISQILNFGLPTPIDVRVIGHDKKNNLKISKELVERISHIPGSVDVHLHQVDDYPELFLNVDRTLLAHAGLTQKNVSDDVLISYSSSSEVSPSFWLDRKNGIPYLISIQTPKYKINTADSLMLMPVSSSELKYSQLLTNLATLERRETVGVANHFNVQPVFDIYANVQGRDLGGVASDIEKIINEFKDRLSPGNEIVMRGIVESMNQAFVRLAIGFIFALILVYSLLVINFQSWIDPLIIIMALPGAITGIAWMLYLTHTTFSVPSLMGTIMSVGLATANSILLVSFANTLLIEGKSSLEAALEAGCIRLRPILMTALAMIVGMIPMALGFGEGGEQNAPLGRAVIGGLSLATFTTLFFVPVIFTYLRHKPNPYLSKNKEESELHVHKVHHIWRNSNGTTQ